MWDVSEENHPEVFGSCWFGGESGMGVSPMDLFLHGRDARATKISPPNQHEPSFLLWANVIPGDA